MVKLSLEDSLCSELRAEYNHNRFGRKIVFNILYVIFRSVFSFTLDQKLLGISKNELSKVPARFNFLPENWHT